MKSLTVILSLLTCTAYGQWFIGGKAAATFSNYKTKTPWTESAKTGYAIGLTATRQIKSNLGLNIELGYVQKGYYHKICNAVSDELNANYIEAPLLINYSFGFSSLRNLKGHIGFGVYGAYWLNGKYKTRGYDVPEENFNFEKNRATRFDFGPAASARIGYLLPNGSIFFDVRFEKGIIDLQKKANDNTGNTNTSMIIGISYVKLMGI